MALNAESKRDLVAEARHRALHTTSRVESAGLDELADALEAAQKKLTRVEALAREGAPVDVIPECEMPMSAQGYIGWGRAMKHIRKALAEPSEQAACGERREQEAYEMAAYEQQYNEEQEARIEAQYEQEYQAALEAADAIGNVLAGLGPARSAIPE